MNKTQNSGKKLLHSSSLSIVGANLDQSVLLQTEDHLGNKIIKQVNPGDIIFQGEISDELWNQKSKMKPRQSLQLDPGQFYIESNNINLVKNNPLYQSQQFPQTPNYFLTQSQQSQSQQSQNSTDEIPKKIQQIKAKQKKIQAKIINDQNKQKQLLLFYEQKSNEQENQLKQQQWMIQSLSEKVKTAKKNEKELEVKNQKLLIEINHLSQKSDVSFSNELKTSNEFIIIQNQLKEKAQQYEQVQLKLRQMTLELEMSNQMKQQLIEKDKQLQQLKKDNQILSSQNQSMSKDNQLIMEQLEQFSESFDQEKYAQLEIEYKKKIEELNDMKNKYSLLELQSKQQYMSIKSDQKLYEQIKKLEQENNRLQIIYKDIKAQNMQYENKIALLSSEISRLSMKLQKKKIAIKEEKYKNMSNEQQSSKVNDLITQVKKLEEVNANQNSELQEFRKKSLIMSQQSQQDDNLQTQILLFAEIESLRKRLAEQTTELNKLRNSQLYELKKQSSQQYY